MKKKTAVATSVIFLVLLFGLAIINLALPKKAFSENENRALQPFPSLTVDSLLDTSFTSDFDTYITDHFAFRDFWVGAKTLAEVALQKKDSGGAYFGKDGYLIERHDLTDNIPQFSSRYINREQYAKNLQYVKEFTEQMQQNYQVDVHTMIVPTASYVLHDKLPAFAPEVDQDELLIQARETIPGFIDLRNALRGHKDEYIYYRTDHHWTSLGACYAYQQWCETVGLPVRDVSWYRQEILSEDFLGTTYSKATLYTAQPDTITAFLPPEDAPVTVTYNEGAGTSEKVSDSMYERSHLENKDKYPVFLDGNQPITRIDTQVQNGRKLLIIKDSYANTFAPFAANDFEQVYMLDLRHYKASVSEFVQEHGITDVLVLYNVAGFSTDTNVFLLPD